MLAAIGLAAGAGIAAALPWGAGVSPDSVVYITAARNLAAGRGLSVALDAGSFVRLAHYPPLYPATLAAPSVFGADPLVTARWLGAALFAANTVLTGCLAFLASRSRAASLAAALLFLAAPPMVMAHTMAWSEPLFIAFVLCAIISLSAYLQMPRPWLLMAAAAAAALAFLTRYAGAAIVLAGIIALAWKGPPEWRQRLKVAAMFALGAAFPGAVWLMRNRLVAGTAADRLIMFHPPDAAMLARGLELAASWFFPLPAPTGTALLGMLALVCAYPALMRRWAAAPVEAGRCAVNTITTLWIVCYSSVVLASISFLDQEIPLDSRMLAPLYPTLVAPVVALWSAAIRHDRSRLSVVGVALVSVVLCSEAAASMPWIVLARREGIGYASRSWRASPLAGRLVELGRAPVFSNAPEAVYLVTGLSAVSLPAKIDPRTRAPNPDYAEAVAAVGRRLSAEGGVLAYFKAVSWRWYLPPETELVTVLGLRPLAREVDGTVYEVSGATAAQKAGS
jgi:4-amino-4-deoxy-L-arabinose transferase-like glycosyltransferase